MLRKRYNWGEHHLMAPLNALFNHERTRQVALNSLVGLLYRAGALFFSIIQVRLLYNVLGQSEYGLWLLIQSVVNWFMFFEFGFSNGLRNKFGEAYTTGNQLLAKQYLNTALSAVLLIAFGVLFVLGGGTFFVNWQDVFNTSNILSGTDTRILVMFTAVSLVGLLIMQVFNGVIYALQRNRYITLITFITQLIQLLLLYVSIELHHVALLEIAFLLCFVPIVVQGAMIWLFFYQHLDFSFINLRFASFRTSSELISTSLKFLALNLTGIVLYTTDNMLIAKLFSPAEVSTYTIIYKYFGLPNLLFGMLTAPLWSAFTQAYNQQDGRWIRKTLRQVTHLCIGFVCIQLGLLVISSDVYRWWIDSQFSVPTLLNVSMMLFFSVQLCLQGYVALINGTGHLNAQIVHSVVGAVLNIPLSIYLAKYMQLGPAGVILATLFTQVFAIFWLPWQIRQILFSIKS